MITVVLYNLIASFDWVYTCRPMAKYWDLTITTGSCINWVKVSVFSSVMNAVTDFLLLLLPIIFLRNLRLPRKQKIGVMLVLMTGGLYVEVHGPLSYISKNTRLIGFLSVLVVSIIKAKRTVSLVDSTDLTWDIVASTIFW